MVQGIGGAFMVPGSLAIISASFGPDERGKAIGTWSSFATITTLVAPALGGFLASAGLWRAVFFINIPLALLSLYALTKVPETRDEAAPRRLDYPGTVLIALGLAGLTYGTIGLAQANGAVSFNPVPLFALIGGLVAIVMFVWVEARSDHPMVPLSLFKQRTFSGTNLATVFLYGALSGTLFFFPLNLIQVQGYPADIAGLTLLPLLLLIAGLSPIMGRLVTRVGPRVPLVLGPAIVGIAFVLLSLSGVTNGPADYWTTYFPAIIILGLGMGITVAPLTTAVMGSVPTHESGIASGISNAVTRSAQGLAVAILGTIALTIFASGLSTRVAQLGIAGDLQAQIHQSASGFGNTQIPSSLDPATQDAVKQAIRLSFVDTFRLVAYISAAMAWIAAAVSAVLVENHLVSADVTSAAAD